MNATLITHDEDYKMTTMHANTAKEAAKMLGVSESTVRRAVRGLGVKQITGRTVAGFVLFPQHPVSVSLSYFR